MPSLLDGGREGAISWEAGQDCVALVLGPLDQARIRSLACLLIGPINPGRQIFRKTTTGSRVGLRRVRPELLGFPGSSQPAASVETLK